MANFIRKLTRYSFEPGSKITVTTTGSPYIPAYCTWAEITGGYNIVFLPNGSYELQRLTSAQAYTCYLAQEAEPPTYTYTITTGETLADANLGWNSGGESVAVFGKNSLYECYPSEAAAGIITGITSASLTPGYGYQQIEFAWLFDHGTARVIEKGALQNDRFVFSQGDKFSVMLVDGFVRYYYNDQLIHESDKDPVGQTFKADISLYSGGDRLDNAAIRPVIVAPTIVSTTRASSQAMAVKGLSTVVTSVASSSGSAIAAGVNLVESTAASSAQANGYVIKPLPATVSPATSFASQAVGGLYYAEADVSFAAMTVLASDKPYGSSEVSMLPMTTEVDTSNYTPAYAVSVAAIPYMTTFGFGLTGEVSVSSNMVMQPADVIASEGVYGESETSMQPMTGSGYEEIEFNGFVGFGDLPELTASGYPSALNRVALTGEVPALAAQGGAQATLVVPSLQLTITGTLTGIGSLSALVPRGVLTASGSGGAAGAFQRYTPSLQLTAYSGSGAAVHGEIPGLEAVGTVGSVAGAQIAVPALLLEASGVQVITGSADLRGETLSSRYAVAYLTGEVPVLTATEAVPVATLKQVFSINISNLGATEYADYPAAYTGSLGGMPVMVDAQGINLMEGSRDNGATFDARVKFAVSDFGDSHLKRLLGVYVAGEGDYELDMKVRTGDEHDSVHVSDNRYHVGAATRRVKPGKGLKGRYIGIEIESIDAEPFTLSSIEYLIGKMERRR